ncbi:MAG: NPCBM/NEW2 domain-containing protein [Rubripirellula sp.]
MPITVVSSGIAKMIGAALLAVLPIKVDTNAGKTVEGNLEGFTADALLIQRDGEVAELPFLDLTSMQPTEVEERTGPTFQVSLIGGSRILAQDLTLDDDGLTIEPRRQNPVRVPVKQVKAIRFRQPAVETDAQWLGIVDRESRGDTLVIRREGDRLDPQQGIVVSMTDETVVFSLDSTEINAPVNRLEGVVFGGGGDVVEDAAIQVTDIYGSRWAVTKLEPSQGEQPLRMELGRNVTHELPVQQILSMRWSGGLSLLANESPAASDFKSYIETETDADLLTKFFGPRVTGMADLLMNGGSSIEYRIEPGFQTLAGTVARDDSVENASQLTVRVTLDGETVWEESLPDLEPRGFELPVKDARRLSFEVDSGSDGDLGDTVRISRPRLLK